MTRAVPLVAIVLGCASACAQEPVSTPASRLEDRQPSPPVDPWQRARERGIDFRALGQEPGWYLEVDYQGSLRLVYDYGEHEVSAPVPSPAAGSGTASLDVMTEAGRLVVRIDDRACSDVMSGQRFPQTVTVELAGRRLEGCGRALDGTATVTPSSAGPVRKFTRVEA
jgi:putative lipoprotein